MTVGGHDFSLKIDVGSYCRCRRRRNSVLGTCADRNPFKQSMESTMNRRSILTLSTAALLCLGAVHAGAQNAPKLTTEEFMVPTQQVGIQLYVRNKHPDGMNAFSPERTILFVHGATYPSETTFDLSVGGASWM